VVTPATFAYTAATLSGASTTGYVAFHLWPKGTEEVRCYGIPNTGKTILNECIQFRKGAATGVMSRESTTINGHRYKVKEKEWHKKLRGMDVVGGSQPVRPNIKSDNPRWILYLTSVDSWRFPSNWSVLNEICSEIDSFEYRQKHDPVYKERRRFFVGERVMKRKWFTGTGCKLLTVALNKVDLLRKWSPQQRGHFCREVADYYTQDHPNNPLSKIRKDVFVEFIAMSVHDGIYYPYNDLDGKHRELKDYIKQATGFL